MLRVANSLVAGLRKGKLSKNRKVKVPFFQAQNWKINIIQFFADKKTGQYQHKYRYIGTNDAPYKNEGDVSKELKNHKRSYHRTTCSLQRYKYFNANYRIRQQNS